MEQSNGEGLEKGDDHLTVDVKITSLQGHFPDENSRSSHWRDVEVRRRGASSGVAPSLDRSSPVDLCYLIV
ncbi:hypothetical protein TNCV_3376431 [Trichonephila clavipes]|nr:hypothetical protein TNCV_3376431 [Trichonephila clavipes]